MVWHRPARDETPGVWLELPGATVLNAAMTENKTGLDAAYALETPEDSVKLYRDWAGTYDDEFASSMDYQLHTHVARAFTEAGGQGPVLDVGAGTGLVAEALAQHDVAPVDGLDISPEMLKVAEDKGVYRATYTDDLTRKLSMGDGAYGGVVSAGTFTHGHVGPEAFDELLRVSRPGAVFALSINAGVYEDQGFARKLDALGDRVTDLQLLEVRIFGDSTDPEHAGDRAMVVIFRKA